MGFVGLGPVTADQGGGASEGTRAPQAKAFPHGFRVRNHVAPRNPSGDPPEPPLTMPRSSSTGGSPVGLNRGGSPVGFHRGGPPAGNGSGGPLSQGCGAI